MAQLGHKTEIITLRKVVKCNYQASANEIEKLDKKPNTSSCRKTKKNNAKNLLQNNQGLFFS